MKELILTITDEMWQEYISAIHKLEGKSVDDALVEMSALMIMMGALEDAIGKINNSCKTEGKNE